MAPTSPTENGDAPSRERAPAVSVEWAEWDPSLGEAEERALAGLVFGGGS
jgi:hypothetical protein